MKIHKSTHSVVNIKSRQKNIIRDTRKKIRIKTRWQNIQRKTYGIFDSWFDFKISKELLCTFSMNVSNSQLFTCVFIQMYEKYENINKNFKNKLIFRDWCAGRKISLKIEASGFQHYLKSQYQAAMAVYPVYTIPGKTLI